MLQLAFKGFSWKFDLRRDGTVVASGSLALVRQRCKLRAEDREFEVRRDGLAGAIELFDGRTVLGSAVKASIFQRKFFVTFGEARYELEAQSVFSRSFVLRREGKVVGSVRPRAFFRRKADVDFPAELPPAAMAFLIWLVAFLWKRQDSSE